MDPIDIATVTNLEEYSRSVITAELDYFNLERQPMIFHWLLNTGYFILLRIS